MREASLRTRQALRHVDNSAGFSLLELLVVVLIIALGIAIVGGAVGNNQPQALRNSARDFANFTALVEEEAVLSREAWGVQLYRTTLAEDGVDNIAYRFLRLTDRGWLPDHPRDVPAGGAFPADIVAELEVEGSEQLIEPLPKEVDEAPSKAGDGKKQSSMTPTIWLAPGGEVTPFALRLRFKGDEHGPVVRSDALGRIECEFSDDEDE